MTAKELFKYFEKISWFAVAAFGAIQLVCSKWFWWLSLTGWWTILYSLTYEVWRLSPNKYD
jgi:hypothetical protein